ncbi:hypothetical protein SPRG_19017 [Saprolegnia parasitica CBS 223.65]|uniref:Cyclic nucleotide-binding domain-containing protein n=1 Tax=Saprolegnia parasitica (strain CBS 223.65) TaxID=695850 RepID=A0A067CY60_SAPPC|nr:hypothetical protein SPRG_19017 [Saprolegnia parasitica CBS 223.65]KDO34165.1 hypothetical protein SPRG_19017 [Saprolegnia parasitica CBS 223.65]|eukprot:XP_012195216.1 hypothetical protein SPRG_19017 [Saprolegnia parasitica CBS 223.65]
MTSEKLVPVAPTIQSLTESRVSFRSLVRQSTKDKLALTPVHFLDKSISSMKQLSGRFSQLDILKAPNLKGSQVRELLRSMQSKGAVHSSSSSIRGPKQSPPPSGEHPRPHRIQPVPDAPDRVLTTRRESGSIQHRRYSNLPRGSTTGSIRNGKVAPHEMAHESRGSKPASIIQTALIAGRLKKKAQVITRRRRQTKHMQQLELAGMVSRHRKVLLQYNIRVVRPEEKPTEDIVLLDQPKYLILPTHQWYKAWQLSTLVIILYQSVMIPYQLAFDTSDTPPTQDYANIAFNLIFGVDLLLTCNCAVAHPRRPDTYITHRLGIFKHYLRGWFILDLLACFPIDMIVYSTISGATNTKLHLLGLLKVLRLPRLLRLARFVRILRILRIPTEWKRWLLYSRYAHLIRLGSLLVTFVYLIHIFNCIWGGYVTSPDWPGYMFGESSQNATAYVLGFYFVLTTVMGQNSLLQTQTEYVYACVLIVIGSVLMATVFGNVANLISNFYENQNNYKKKMEQLLSSMNLMKLPLDLQNRINEYYQVMWERHGTLDGQPLMFTKELSRNLSVEVELYLRMDMINRVPVFQKCSKKVVQEIVMRLQLQVYLPGDYIVVKGEIGFDMFFVQSGSCEVTKPLSSDPRPYDNEEVLKVLVQGDYFGEISLLMNCKRTANVRACTFAELCVLTRSVFEDITAQYIEDRQTIEKFIKEMYDPKALEAILKAQNEDEPTPHEVRAEEKLNAILDTMATTNAKIERLELLVTLLLPHAPSSVLKSVHRATDALGGGAASLPPLDSWTETRQSKIYE